jgi:hypothetical protein
MSGGTALRFQTRHARRGAERKKEGSRSWLPPYQRWTSFSQSRSLIFVFTVMRVAVITPVKLADMFPEVSYASSLNGLVR